jgi:hypothetical protein
MNRSIKVIGAGGIGTKLLDPLCQFLNYYHPQPAEDEDDTILVEADTFEITIIDGDTFEQRNRERQDFYNFGNKAEVKATELMQKYDLTIHSVPEYLNESNISSIIQEDDIVLVCVDNHDTRALIAEKVATLQNVVLISGGNGFYTGDVLTNVRIAGQNYTASITRYHEEISAGDGQHPQRLGCEALHQAEPQLLFANMGAAWVMLCRFYKICILGQLDTTCENDFDILTGEVLAKQFPV